ncbi:MAG: hypothetical protein AAGA57_04280 [Planctomycetota bacterium]
MTLRTAFFGAALAVAGGLLAAIAQLETTATSVSRPGLWGLLLVVLLFMVRGTASATRAIWLFCCHMFLIERDFYGPGGNHQWLLANLKGKHFSTTYGFYVTLFYLPIACGVVCFFDIMYRFEAPPGTPAALKPALLVLVVVCFSLLAWCARRLVFPSRVIGMAARQAIWANRSILDMEAMGDEDLRQHSEYPKAYVELLLHHREARSRGRTATTSSHGSG